MNLTSSHVFSKEIIDLIKKGELDAPLFFEFISLLDKHYIKKNIYCNSQSYFIVEEFFRYFTYLKLSLPDNFYSSPGFNIYLNIFLMPEINGLFLSGSSSFDISCTTLPAYITSMKANALRDINNLFTTFKELHYYLDDETMSQYNDNLIKYYIELTSLEYTNNFPSDRFFIYNKELSGLITTIENILEKMEQT